MLDSPICNFIATLLTVAHTVTDTDTDRHIITLTLTLSHTHTNTVDFRWAPMPMRWWGLLSSHRAYTLFCTCAHVDSSTNSQPVRRHHLPCAETQVDTSTNPKTKLFPNGWSLFCMIFSTPAFCQSIQRSVHCMDPFRCASVLVQPHIPSTCAQIHLVTFAFLILGDPHLPSRFPTEHLEHLLPF